MKMYNVAAIEAREVADNLDSYELEVLTALVEGNPKPWGAAPGAAYEVLQSKGLVNYRFEATDLGRAVARSRT
jgi:hypothetical protein